MGLQTPNDLSFATDDDVLKYCDKIQKDLKPNTKFEDALKNHDPLLRDLLRGMLEVNPYFRWSPSECLRSPYFDDIRVLSLEKLSSEKLKLDVDQNGAFDYEDTLRAKLSKEEHLLMIWNEYLKYN